MSPAYTPTSDIATRVSARASMPVAAAKAGILSIGMRISPDLSMEITLPRSRPF
ncbi:hypothetical protein JF542_18040 [Salipiger bermudensis]|nr:hypothetical protein [Salipiger bermudensis]